MEKLIELLKPYRGRLAAVAVTDAIGMMMTIFMPYIMSEIVDNGIANGDMRVILTSCAVMLLLSILSIAASLVANRINTDVTTGYTADVCRATFRKINSLSYTQYSKIGPSGLLTRSTDDIFNIEGAASSLVYTIVTVPIMLIGSAVLSFIADVTLSLVFMLSIPPVMLIVFVFMRPLYGMWDKSDAYVDRQNKIVRERLGGLRVVRAFNNEAREHGRVRHATEEMAKYMIRANVRGGYIEPIAMLLLNVATVALVAVGGLRAEWGLLDNTGDLIAVIQYVALISGALINLSWTIAWLPRLRVSIKRINEIHSMPREDDGAEEHALWTEGSDIILNNVSFAYPGAKESVLHNISMSIAEGEEVAVIGGTGCGKTTLVRLLLGMLEATEGDIFLGGREYRTLSRRDIRKRFSVALQRAMIFEGTVRDNVLMGRPEADDSELFSAMEDCEIADFVRSTDEGADYLLVGTGRNISGGQKQRLSMSRTVIRDADIYIFDDSYSALDFLTEKKIKEKLAVRLDGKSIITVTQRISTAMSADRIYVMDGGRIVGVGTHSELIRHCDIYREICISQLGRESVGGDA